jgi:hypothetical protein
MAPPQGWGILAARVMRANGELLQQHTINIHSFDTGKYWEVKTYGQGSTNSDPYYQENMVIGDLPAGNYEVWIDYEGSTYDLDLKVQPGLVTYFTFHGKAGFRLEPPPLPDADGFAPEPPGAETNLPAS